MNIFFGKYLSCVKYELMKNFYIRHQRYPMKPCIYLNSKPNTFAKDNKYSRTKFSLKYFVMGEILRFGRNIHSAYAFI